MYDVGMTVFCLLGSAVTTIWVPDALSGAVAGVALGSLLGVVALVLTKWESTPHSLHYTPTRWLVLFITSVVTARLLYGLYRSWQVARAGLDGTSVVTAFGIPESWRGRYRGLLYLRTGAGYGGSGRSASAKARGQPSQIQSEGGQS